MESVTLIRPSPGFIGVKLIALLREHGFGLAESHRLTTDFNAGQRVSILFENPAAAARFADAATSLDIETLRNHAALAKSA